MAMLSRTPPAILLALALVAAPAWMASTATVEAAAPVEPGHDVTLRGPSYRLADQVASYSGTVRLRVIAAGAGLPGLVGAPGTPVVLELNGAAVAEGRTNHFGNYWIDMAIATPGPHVVVAVVGRGTQEEARSPPLLVFVPAPPEAPTALGAAVGPAWDEVGLSWSEPGDDGGAQVQRYNVYRAVSASGPFTFLGSTDAATRAWRDVFGVAGDLVYAISASNEAGEGPRAEVLVPASLPSTPPTNLSAVTGPVWDDVTLTWAAPVDTGGVPLGGYVVERAPMPNGSFVERARVNASSTTFADTGESETHYTYRVSALTRAGFGEPAEVEVHVPSQPVLDSLRLAAVRFRVCDDLGCRTVDAGGTATTYQNVHYMYAELEGSAYGERFDEVEVDGVMAWLKPVYCSPDVCAPYEEVAFEFAIRPDQNNELSASLGAWADGMGHGFCEDYDFTLRAEGGTLQVNDTAHFRVCRP